MATSIKQIKEWPIGYKSGKFTLIAKTIKGKTDIDERRQSQRLILTDGEDDILAEMPVRRNYCIIGNTKIHVVAARRDERDVSNRMVPALIIDRWYIDFPKQTSEQENFGMSEQWREDIRVVKSKCKFGLVRVLRAEIGFKEPLTKQQKTLINSDVEFIVDIDMTGE
jgi:hypothetical protein